VWDSKAGHITASAHYEISATYFAAIDTDLAEIASHSRSAPSAPSAEQQAQNQKSLDRDNTYINTHMQGRDINIQLKICQKSSWIDVVSVPVVGDTLFAEPSGMSWWYELIAYSSSAEMFQEKRLSATVFQASQVKQLRGVNLGGPSRSHVERSLIH
jgi:hypothetical protein